MVNFENTATFVNMNKLLNATPSPSPLTLHNSILTGINAVTPPGGKKTVSHEATSYLVMEDRKRHSLTDPGG